MIDKNDICKGDFLKKGDVIIVGMVVVAFVVLFAVFMMGPAQGLKDSHINIVSADTLKNGDHLKVNLSDAGGNPLVNQTVKINMLDGQGNRQSLSAVTDSVGIAETIIKTNDTGRISVNASFGGDDKHNSNSTLKIIEIIQGSSNNATNSSSAQVNNSSSSYSDYSQDYSSSSDDYNSYSNGYSSYSNGYSSYSNDYSDYSNGYSSYSSDNDYYSYDSGSGSYSDYSGYGSSSEVY